MLPWISHRPSYLIFYATSKCNLRCSHCFYLDELNKHEDLRLDEIQQIANRLAPLDFVRFTGGEPFIRKDLPQVIESFHKLASVDRMGLISNGTLPDRIVPMVEEIFNRCPSLTLDLGVSIDGLPDVHDELRGRKGGFELSRQTVRELVALRDRLPGLLTSIVVTVSNRNLDSLEELYQELASWDVDRLSVNMVRGRIADESLKKVPFERYREFAERLEAYHRTRQLGLKPMIQRAKNRLTRQAIQQVVSGQPSDVPCRAADTICVLYSDGVLAVCESLDEVNPDELVLDGEPVEPILGNVRDFNYDVRAVLATEKAERARRWIQKTNCSCTHECFLTASILWGGMNTYPALLRESLRVG